MNARYYDPEMGRFLSEGPAGLGGRDLTLYSYAGNNPVVFVDPSGLCGQGSGTYVAGQIWTPDPSRGLNSAESAYRHWGDHGSDFPQYNNAKQYAEGAKDFLNNPSPGSNGKVRPNGDVMIYDPKTNTFGVKNSNGVPRTMFKPSAGAAYFVKQAGKLIVPAIILLSPKAVE